MERLKEDDHGWGKPKVERLKEDDHGRASLRWRGLRRMIMVGQA